MFYLYFMFMTFSLQANDPVPGIVSDSITCKANPKQTYAAYLPKKFSQDKTWPLILCFEPAARGKIPVNLFKDVAEKYGFLLFASNNSRNYNEDLITESVNALWVDVMGRYPVDNRRIYAAGMSGGARVATRLADQSGQLAGLIACAAGYGAGSAPSKGDPYVFAGIMGDLDFNYSEFKGLESSLEKAHIPYNMIYFEGVHGWPPKEYCTQAVEWLVLQAMKRKLQEPDEEWLQMIFEQEMAEIYLLLDHENTFKGYQRLVQLIKDFEGVYPIKEARMLLQKLSKTKTVVEGKKLDKKVVQFEKRIKQPFNQRLNYIGYKDFDAFQGKKNLAWFSREYKGLKKRIDKELNPMKKTMYQRIESALFTFCFEMMIVSLNQKELNQAEQYYNYGVIVKPHSVSMSYNLACLKALSGDSEAAIQALDQAVKWGYKNVGSIEQDKDLDSIKSLEGYKNIIRRMKATH